jgi:ATP-dependent Clp protease ATP-binding subunit ClpC
VFERFTERARQAVVLAQDEARALGHGFIGTEHLLLGLLREEQGLAARALGSLGVTLEAAREHVVEIVGHGEGDASTGQIPFTPRGKQALELALRESQALGHGYIGTEHILLGLVRLDDGVASGVLHRLGADEERVRAEVVRALGGPAVLGAPGLKPGRVPPWAPRVSTRVEPGRRIPPAALLVAGWVLFALALGAGILVGWAIWGA